MTANSPELLEYEASVTDDQPGSDGLTIVGVMMIVVMTMAAVLVLT